MDDRQHNVLRGRYMDGYLPTFVCDTSLFLHSSVFILVTKRALRDNCNSIFCIDDATPFVILFSIRVGGCIVLVWSRLVAIIG